MVLIKKNGRIKGERSALCLVHRVLNSENKSISESDIDLKYALTQHCALAISIMHFKFGSKDLTIFENRTKINNLLFNRFNFPN